MKIKINNKAAFTLVEMILAIGVAAIVLVAVNAVLFTALHLREVTVAAVDAATPLDQTAMFLRRDLQCAVTTTNGTSKILSGSFKAGNVSVDGYSDPVAAEFFTATGALSEGAPWGDIQRVTYGLKNSSTAGAARSLYRTVTRNLLPANTPEVEEQLMLENVENLQFTCYDGSRWLDAWDTSDPLGVNTNLPAAVRVEIRMAGNPALAPVQFVVPIYSVARTNMVLAGS